MPPQVAATGHVNHRPESRLHSRSHLFKQSTIIPFRQTNKQTNKRRTKQKGKRRKNQKKNLGGGRIGRQIVGMRIGIIVGFEILRLRFEITENEEAGKSRREKYENKSQGTHIFQRPGFLGNLWI